MSNNLGISIVKIAIYSHFSSLKVEDLGQNPGGFRVLKNRELQNRELQNRELQGLPVLDRELKFIFQIKIGDYKKVTIYRESLQFAVL